MVHRDASSGLPVLVVTRFRAVDDPFLDRARAALDALAARPGFRSGRIGRNVDDPSWWTITTEWEHVGAYRRALSAYEVKLTAVPLLSLAVDEPSAYEVVVSVGPDGSTGGSGRSDRAADAGTVGLGDASAPVVLGDLDR